MEHPPLQIELRRPDDFHVHLRDGDMLNCVVNYTARQFARAIVMPNLMPPITTIAAAQAYRERIIAALNHDLIFTPLMTCYLTDEIDVKEVKDGHAQRVFTACKLYPQNATTNSAHGVSDVRHIYPALDVMQSVGMPLLVHGEVIEKEIDIFDREAVFIERTLAKLVEDFPELKVVFEHVTTENAVNFVESSSENVAATITPHHLRINRSAMFEGGIRPHAYCLPVAKREKHRLALRRAATSGSPKFFLGTDSAPHLAADKESACGCAGIFNAPYALESYAQTFEEEGALEKLAAFAGEHGAQFYGLPLNEDTVVLKRSDATVPKLLNALGTKIIPFHAGETLAWSYVSGG